MADAKTRFGDAGARHVGPAGRLWEEQEQAFGEFRKETGEEFAALRKDVDRALDAIQHNAKAMREEDAAGLGQVRAPLLATIEAAARDIRGENAARFEMIRKTAEHALDQMRQSQEAWGTRLREELAAADARAKDRIAVLDDWAIARFDKLQGAIAEAARDAKGGVDGAIAGFGLVVRQLGERVGELETRSDVIEHRFHRFHRFHRLLRVRDAARRLRPLFEEARPLAERLLSAEREDYPDGKAWRADYEAWHAKLREFWRLASRWSPPGIDPFANPEEEVESARGVPADERFADCELQRRWRVLLVAHMKHGQLAGEALARIEAEAYGEPNPA